MKIPRSRSPKGQATTEVVLLMPLLLLFLFGFAKVFAMLVLVQKMEIASYYAARRWQLESHRNVQYEAFDDNQLRRNIEMYVGRYLGYDNPATASFLGLDRSPTLTVNRTQVWNVVTLTVNTRPIAIKGLFSTQGYKFEVTKYVPNRDRPIAFVLPGLN